MYIVYGFFSTKSFRVIILSAGKYLQYIISWQNKLCKSIKKLYYMYVYVFNVAMLSNYFLAQHFSIWIVRVNYPRNNSQLHTASPCTLLCLLRPHFTPHDRNQLFNAYTAAANVCVRGATSQPTPNSQPEHGIDTNIYCTVHTPHTHSIQPRLFCARARLHL